MKTVSWSRRLVVTFSIILLSQSLGYVLVARNAAAQQYVRRLPLDKLPALPIPGLVVFITDPMGWALLMGWVLGSAFLTSVILVELLNVVYPRWRS